jgi:hypothetical protein
MRAKQRRGEEPGIEFETADIPPEVQQRVGATCPLEAPRVVGGGFATVGAAYDTAIAASRPTPSRDGWEAWVDDYNEGTSVTFDVFAICSAAL